MSAAATKEIVRLARALRNAAPQTYNEFHAAFAEYTRESTEILIAGEDRLPLLQGHTQQCMKILALLTEAKNHG